MIYTILIEKDGAVIAAQETFESTDAAIRDIVDYGYAPHAILELQEDGTTQAYFGDALWCVMDQHLDEQREA